MTIERMRMFQMGFAVGMSHTFIYYNKIFS
jgi:hypothetical protein